MMKCEVILGNPEIPEESSYSGSEFQHKTRLDGSGQE